MSEAPAIAELLAELASILARFGARWYVFGAQAVLVWGRPRLTSDADVTVFLEPGQTHTFVLAMAEAGFKLRVADIDDFVARTRVLPFAHAASGLGLDVVLGGPGLEEEFVRTARPVDLGGVTVPVIGPEELIVTKVLAGRPKDLEDVRGILVAQGETLDLERARGLIREVEAAIDQSHLLPCFEDQLRAVGWPRTRADPSGQSL